MKFYVRESATDEYRLQNEDKPRGLLVYQMKPNDIWCSLSFDYRIDKIEYSTMKVYVTKTKLLKPRKRSFYVSTSNR